MIRKSIPNITLRFLYGKSGNKCAFPDCNEPIFEDNGLLTGKLPWRSCRSSFPTITLLHSRRNI